jgi:transposase
VIFHSINGGGVRTVPHLFIKVYETKEYYTTKTYSFCSSMNTPGLSRVYECKNCKKNIERDVNEAKNILMKGIVTHLC